MRQTHAWHKSRIGRVVLWLGSIQLAVPVLVLVAAALAWGTFLESVHGAKVSRATVYGAWWFLALMGLVCMSLVAAVATRYPWKRKHIGFMTVHASLIAMIVGGFWSMFGRVEGKLALEEGGAGSQIEMDEERLELAEHISGQFTPLGGAPVPALAARVTVSGVPVQVVERWENIREEELVVDNGPQPLRAVEVSLDTAASAPSGTWIGEEGKTGGISALGDLRIRVLPDEAEWNPAPVVSPESGHAGFSFVVGEVRYPLPDTAQVGQDAFAGWKIASLKRFAHAMVGATGLTESQADHENPAVEIVISDGKGSSERHTAFLNFPDMVMAKTLDGTAVSGARLVGTPAHGLETLVIYGPAKAIRLGYVAPDGTGRRIDRDAAQPQLPWTVDLGSRRVAILRQFTRAHADTRYIRAAAAAENRPALVVRVGDSVEPIVAPWKALTPLPMLGRDLALRYGPRTVPLPFSVRLTDFRKADYPGTEMAMSYESDVAVTLEGERGAVEQPFKIFMNHPYSHGSWKVYQSGFVGEAVSIFSVMKDPGLPLTYIGSIGLCLGILLTFYSRSLSWGHPGIPVAFVEKEHPNVPLSPSVLEPAPLDEPVGTGSI